MKHKATQISLSVILHLEEIWIFPTCRFWAWRWWSLAGLVCVLSALLPFGRNGFKVWLLSHSDCFPKYVENRRSRKPVSVLPYFSIFSPTHKQSQRNWRKKWKAAVWLKHASCIAVQSFRVLQANRASKCASVPMKSLRLHVNCQQIHFAW